MASALIKTVAILTGLVVAGEALALTLGMRILGRRDSPWICRKNDLLLEIDLFTGLGLIILTAISAHPDAAIPFYVLVILSIITHSYRELEFLTRAESAFCANKPLFVVNNLKLIGLLILAADAIAKIL